MPGRSPAGATAEVDLVDQNRHDRTRRRNDHDSARRHLVTAHLEAHRRLQGHLPLLQPEP